MLFEQRLHITRKVDGRISRAPLRSEENREEKRGDSLQRSPQR